MTLNLTVDVPLIEILALDDAVDDNFLQAIR